MRRLLSKIVLVVAMVALQWLWAVDISSAEGILLAGNDGTKLPTDTFGTWEFWHNLWGDDIISEDEADGKGKPWYKSGGLPIQREGQNEYYVERIVDTTYKIYSKDDYLAVLDIVIEDKSSFLLGGFAPAKFSIEIMNDIDMGGETLRSIEILKGDFIGNNHTISNFNLNSSALIMDLSGTVRNLAIEGATINSSTRNSAVIASNVLSDGKIEDCMVKDCEVVGIAPMGMVAGVVAGNCRRCVVVNGTLAVDDETMSTDGSPVGGIAGVVSSGGTVQYNICLLDKFRTKLSYPKNHTDAKPGYLGRIVGENDGNLSKNYGWVETGFLVWDDYVGDYYDIYYPYWGAEEAYQGINNCTETSKHGKNIFVGDYYSVDDAQTQTYQSEDLVSLGFAISPWSYDKNSEALFPVLSGSGIDSTDLVARRGYENDVKESAEWETSTYVDVYDINTVYTRSLIGTAYGFCGIYKKSVIPEKLDKADDFIRLGTDILLAANAEADSTTLWAFSGKDATDCNAENHFVELGYRFDGMGHKISGLKFPKYLGKGLFEKVYQIRNLMLANFDMSSSENTSSPSEFGALSYSFFDQDDGFVKNILVTNSKFKIPDDGLGFTLGGIVGALSYGFNVSISKCIVINNSFTAPNANGGLKQLGGIIGSLPGGYEVDFILDKNYVVNNTFNCLNVKTGYITGGKGGTSVTISGTSYNFGNILEDRDPDLGEVIDGTEQDITGAMYVDTLELSTEDWNWDNDDSPYLIKKEINWEEMQP